MKMKLIAMVAFSVTSSLSFGALYTLNNGSGSTASGVITTTGQTFRSGTIAGDAFSTGGGTSGGPGVVAFGIFSTDALSGFTTAQQFVDAFTAFGTTGTFAATGTTGNRSVFSSAQSVAVTGSVFANQFMYLFAGNGSTFLNSTQILVAKSTFQFLAADDAATAPIVQTIRPGNSSILFGSAAASVQTATTDTSTTAGWTMGSFAPIPEPSAALLGALGALGLLRRRRN